MENTEKFPQKPEHEGEKTWERKSLLEENFLLGKKENDGHTTVKSNLITANERGKTQKGNKKEENLVKYPDFQIKRKIMPQIEQFAPMILRFRQLTGKGISAMIIPQPNHRNERS